MPYDDKNVLGGALAPCSTSPRTGFYRDGCCNTGPEDLGLHVVCAATWREAFAAGVAAPVVLAATHEETLAVIPLDALKQHALDLQ